MVTQPPGPQKGTALYTNHINAIERSPLGPPHLNVDIDVMIDSPINIHLGSTLETGVRGCRGCVGCPMESWVGRYLSVDRRGRSMTYGVNVRMTIHRFYHSYSVCVCVCVLSLPWFTLSARSCGSLKQTFPNTIRRLLDVLLDVPKP